MENMELDFAEEMKNLGLIEDGDQPLDTTNLPTERSNTPRELPQPGTVRFRVPGNVKDAIKPVLINGEQRIQLQLRDDCALIDAKSGLQVHYNVSGVEQAIKKDGQVTGYKSELAYFIKSTGFEGPLSSKADQVKAIYQSAGKEFKADVSYETRCNPERPIYKDRAKQAQNGCGQRYRMKAESYTDRNGVKVIVMPIPRDSNGAYQQKFSCQCGGEISVFLRLSNYKKG